MSNLRAMTPVPPQKPWRLWLLEELALGGDPRHLRDEAVARGIPSSVVETEIVRMGEDPCLRIARRLARHVRRLEMPARLRRELAALSDAAEIAAWPEGAPFPDEDMFRRALYATGQPVVFRGFCTAWPAVRESKWSADAPPAPDALLADIELPAYVDPKKTGKEDVFVFAQKETRVLGLRHEQRSMFICQALGTTSFRLAAPYEPVLLDAVDGCELPDDRALTSAEAAVWLTAKLAAGDALFLPVGWWHDVTMEGPAIAVAFTGFFAPNEFPWYAPGEV